MKKKTEMISRVEREKERERERVSDLRLQYRESKVHVQMSG